MVEVLATINTTEKSVGRVCNYLTNRRVKHRVVSSGDNMIMLQKSILLEIHVLANTKELKHYSLLLMM